jgi:hypothetical protein
MCAILRFGSENGHEALCSFPILSIWNGDDSQVDSGRCLLIAEPLSALWHLWMCPQKRKDLPTCAAQENYFLSEKYTSIMFDSL